MTTKGLNETSPTGGQPAGLQDTATERIANVPQSPCKRNLLHDPHLCRCAMCPECNRQEGRA